MVTAGRLNDLPHIRHAFFGREGGVSRGLYASLNCGFGSGDDHAAVAENRRRAMARVDSTPERLVTVHQTHSADAVCVEQPWAPEQSPRADAMVTDRPGIALGVLTADCAPVLLADAGAGVIGAAHAGWRGAREGIIEACVEAMLTKGARAEAIHAGVGPCIAQRSYEVGPEFPELFLDQDQQNADFFCPAPRDHHFLFDLKGYIARRLALCGISRVEVLPCDTCAEGDRFFSYRRARKLGEPDYGRDLSVIYLEA